jgi:hypothetical protein
MLETPSESGSERQSVAWPTLLASWAITFVAVNLGWAFFAMDFPTALLFFRRLILG